MWIRQIFLAVFGFGAGVGLAGGFFALLIALGIISRFAHQTQTGQYLWLYEMVVAAGGIFGIKKLEQMDKNGGAGRPTDNPKVRIVSFGIYRMFNDLSRY